MIRCDHSAIADITARSSDPSGRSNALTCYYSGVDTEADGPIRAEMAQLRERLRKLHATLRGPRVSVDIHWGGHTISDSCTLAEAFAWESDIYGEPTGVTVGGCLITREAWEIDGRNPEAAEEIARREKAAAEKVAAEEAKRAKKAALEVWRQQVRMALYIDDTRVTDWVLLDEGAFDLPAMYLDIDGHEDPIIRVRYRQDDRVTHVSGPLILAGVKKVSGRRNGLGRLRIKPTRVDVSGKRMGIPAEGLPVLEKDDR